MAKYSKASSLALYVKDLEKKKKKKQDAQKILNNNKTISNSKPIIKDGKNIAPVIKTDTATISKEILGGSTIEQKYQSALNKRFDSQINASNASNPVELVKGMQAQQENEKQKRKAEQEKKKTDWIDSLKDGYDFGDVTKTILGAVGFGEYSKDEKAVEVDTDSIKNEYKDYTKKQLQEEQKKIQKKILSYSDNGAKALKNENGNYTLSGIWNTITGNNAKKLSNDKEYQELLERDNALTKMIQEENVANKKYQKGIVGAAEKTSNVLVGNMTKGIRGIEGTVKKVIGKEDTISEKTYAEKYSEQAFAQTKSKLGKAGLEIAGSVGQMMPQMVIPGGKLATAVGFANYGGSAYNEAKEQGYTEEQATKYGIANGTLEMALNKVLPSFKINGKNIYGKTTSDKLTSKIMNKVLNNNAIKSAILDASGEFTEEYLQEFLDPIVRETLLEEDNGVGIKGYSGAKVAKNIAKYTAQNFFSKENLHAGVLGFVTSGMLGGVNTYNAYKQEKTNKKNVESNLTQNMQIENDNIKENTKEYKENLVSEKEYNNRIQKLEAKGTKLTTEEKNKLKKEVQDDLQNGNISIDTIESVFAENEYNKYKQEEAKLKSLKKQIEELDSKKISELTVKEYGEIKDKKTALEEQINNIESSTTKQELQTKMSEILKSDDSAIQNSYGKELKVKNFKESAKQYWNESEDSKSAIDTIEKVIRDKNYNITLDPNIKTKTGKEVAGRITTNENGEVDIKLNPNSNRTVEFLLTHEITHAIETDKMKNLVMDYAKKNKEFDTALNELKKTYETEDVSDEVLADISGQLLGNQDFILNLSTKKPNIFKKMYDKIISIANKITGNSKEDLFIKDLKNKWEKAYRTKNNNLNGKTNYMMTGTKGMKNSIKVDNKFSDIKDKFIMANEMNNNSYSNEEIRQQTGWFKNIKGNWEFEVSDHNTKFKILPEENKEYNLSELFEAKTLYKMYPELKNISVKFKKLKGKNGSFNTETNTITVNNSLLNNPNNARGTILHEIQHYIQKYEGLPTGTTILFGNEQYADSLGEIEATDTKNRRDLNVSERKAIIPESAKKNPVHPNRNNILNRKRSLVEKTVEKIYNKFGGNQNEVSEEIDIQDNKSTNEKTDRTYSKDKDGINELDNSSFSVLKNSDGKEIDISNLEENSTMKRFHYNRKYDKNNIVTYRGEGDNTGYNPAFYGLGLYTTLDSKYAKEYGNVFIVDSSLLPDNPLKFKTQNDFHIWEQELARELGIRKRELYSDDYGVEQYIKKLGYDGLLIGVGKDTDLISYKDVAIKYSQQSDKWQEHLEKNYKATGKRTNMADLRKISSSNTNTSNNTNKAIAPISRDVIPYLEMGEIVKKDIDPNYIPKIPIAEPELKKNKIAPIAKKDSKLGRLKEKATEAIHTGQYLFTNKNEAIDRFSDKVGNKNIKILADHVNNVQGEISTNINNAQIDNSGKKIGKSIVDIFEPARKENLTDAFNDYLFNLSNIARHEQGKGSVISITESDVLVKEYEKAYPQMKKWAQDVNTYNKNLLYKQAEAGIISEDTADYLTQKYSFYVPFIENIEKLKTNNTGKIITKSTVKTAKGGSSKNLLGFEEAMIRQTQSAITNIRKNQLYNEIIDSISEKSIDFGYNTNPNVSDNNLITDAQNYLLSAYKDGKMQQAKIDKELYDGLEDKYGKSIKELEQKLSFATKPLQKISNVRRNILTTWSPTFIITNPLKDIQDAPLNSKYGASWIKNYPKAMKELTTGKGQHLEEFLNMYGQGNLWGGENVDSGVYDVSNIAKTNKKESSNNKVVKLSKAMVKKTTQLNEIMEMGPRYAEYLASLEHGTSQMEALYNAREVTTNFGRGGVITKALNRNGFTFLNASVQGFSKLIRNFSGENGARGVINASAKVVALGIAPALFNALWFDDDDDYNDLPDYIKDNYYLFKTDDNDFIRIPKGRMISIFGSAARRTLERSKGKRNEMTLKEDIKSYGKNAWSQVGIGDLSSNNILAPLNQAKNNNAWYGGDIVPSRLQDKPAEEQYDSSIDKVSIWIGKKLGISPYKVNYVIDQYSGGIGDMILPLITDEAQSDSNSNIGIALAPLRDKFTANSILDNKNVSNFYTKNDQLKVVANSSKATNEDKLVYKYAKSVSSDMGALYQEMRKVQENNELSKSEKFKKALIIKEEINKLAKEGLNGYSKVENVDNYGIVGNREFYKWTNEEGEEVWSAPKDEDLKTLNSLGLSVKEKGTYYKTQSAMYDAWSKYDDYNVSKSHAISSIINSSLPDEVKYQLYNNSYNKNKINVAQTIGIDANTFLNYAKQNFKASKDSNGKSISGSKKRKVYNYLNKMNIDYEDRLILAKMQGYETDEGNTEIVNYLNNSNVTPDEYEAILEQLKFTIKNGYVRW